MTYGPFPAAIITVKFIHGTREILKVEPKVLSLVPLQYGKVVSRSNAMNGRRTTPRSGVLGNYNVAIDMTPVDLKFHLAECESTEGGTRHGFTGVKSAWGPSTIVVTILLER